jgi:biotin carboxyl carrier protein
VKLTVDGHEFEVETAAGGGNVTVNRAGYGFRIENGVDGPTVVVGNRRFAVLVEDTRGGAVSVVVDGRRRTVNTGNASLAARKEPRAVPAPISPIPGGVCTPLAGRVASVRVELGAVVAIGDTLMTLEAMKLENEIRSPYGGTIKEIRAVAGERVPAGALLVVVDVTEYQ